jgi:hypothetical protein
MMEETSRHVQSKRAGNRPRAALVCLLALLFSVTAQQFSTSADLLLLPQQTEQESTNEEFQEGKFKALEPVAASGRKALNQSLRALVPASNRTVFLRIAERRPALASIAFCWCAHTYRHRGPPRSGSSLS